MRLRSLSVRLTTPDLDRVLAFYRDVLGLAVARRDDAFAFVSQGDVELMFWSDPNAKIPGVRGLVFEMDGVRDLHARLVEKKIPILWGPEDYDYGRREFSVADPDGNELIFSEEIDVLPSRP